jgi:4-amino-4-deoxy-L-arabinose transferase-like glycosyltransferase
MTRVMHWAQNRSLDHYPTAYHHQLMMPPWAEMAILTLRTLWGNDRFANLVQWFSMVGSVVGVSALAAMLGARFRGQLLTAVFALSIPMGVLQATSTHNDYVVAFWLVCLAYFVLLSKKRPLDSMEKLIMAGAVGLGMLTKVTFYIYALPWLAWFLFSLNFKVNRRRLVFDLVVMTLIVVILNLGYWSRNLSTYGTPFGPGDFVRSFTATEIMPPEASASRDPSISKNCTEPSLPWRIYSAEVKMIGRNLITPSNTINQWFRERMAEFPCAFGSNYATTMTGAIWNHEDTAGNFLHTGLVGVSLVLLGLQYHDARKRYVITYALMSLIGYLLLPVIIGNGSSLVSLRFQLPFFVMWGPVFGLVLEGATKPWLVWLVAIGLLIAAMPWVFFNNTRPLIGAQPWTTRLPSILGTPSGEILFAMNLGAYDEYLEVAKTIRQSDCRDIGLVLDSHDFEYQLWWLLDAPQSGRKLKSIETFSSLDRYLDLTYEPCAIICTLCGDRSEYAGMPLVERYGSLSLYLEN